MSNLIKSSRDNERIVCSELNSGNDMTLPMNLSEEIEEEEITQLYKKWWEIEKKCDTLKNKTRKNYYKAYASHTQSETSTKKIQSEQSISK